MPTTPADTRAAWLVATLLIPWSSALKEHDFRKCADTPFCRLHRTPPDEDPGRSRLEGRLRVQLPPPAGSLGAAAAALRERAGLGVRVHIDEDPAPPPSRSTRRSEARRVGRRHGRRAGCADGVPRPRQGPLRGDASFASDSAIAPRTDCGTAVPRRARSAWYASGPTARRRARVRVQHAPLTITLADGDGAALAVLNAGGRLRFEPFGARASETAEAASAAEPVRFGAFTDPRQRPELGGARRELPARAPRVRAARADGRDALPPTAGAPSRGRLFNLDVFEYELDHR